MEKISVLKRNWLLTQLDILINQGLSKREICRRLDIAPQTLNNLTNEGKGITDNFLDKFIQVFDVSTFNLQDTAPKVQEQFTLRSDRRVDMQAVPLYELDATAGLVSLFDEHTRQAPINHLQIPDLPPCDGALYVRGDSMYPLLKSGDIVLYKEVHDHSNILYGEMYLLSFTIAGDDYITIKYIQRAEQPGMVRLVSHNPHHQPKDIPIDSIRALALIKASVRYCTMG
ncbi:MAG: LexA family transcriptional regulator [Alistipes sp.]|nr:LexA family transcriptional regulator [Alistipes sp.]